MGSRRLSFLLLLSIAVGAAASCGAPGDDPTECAALESFGKSLNYKQWKKSSAWLTSA